MTRRLPPVPTIIVLAAAGIMVWLGLWQLDRRAQKADLLARWSAARTLSPVAWPAVPDESLLYRRADGFCLAVTAVSARAGERRDGAPGWRHIARCRTGAEGPGMAVDIGWSRAPEAPARWIGGKVTGVIGRDRDTKILLVADRPAPGLEPSAWPDPANEPNNHLAYAIQWFAFAATALVIYALALRHRWRRGPSRGDESPRTR